MPSAVHKRVYGDAEATTTEYRGADYRVRSSVWRKLIAKPLMALVTTRGWRMRTRGKFHTDQTQGQIAA